MDNPIFDPRRACGRRVPGGVYAETRLAEEGLPLEAFLHCPPKPIDLVQFGLTSVGVQLLEFQGLWHVFDVVGQEHYPYVADFVEETRRKGASRRLPKNLDFEKLSEGSRLVLIHARAIIENFTEYSQPPVVSCPKDFHLSELDEMCGGLWWHDIPASDLERSLEVAHHRRIPGGVSYIAYPCPEVVEPQYQYGIFMSLPITHLAVIAGRNPTEERLAESAYLVAGASGLPVVIEEV